MIPARHTVYDPPRLRALKGGGAPVRLVGQGFESISLSRAQSRFSLSKEIINVVFAGRRSAKSMIMIRRMIRAALAPQVYNDAHYFLCAPTQQQAKNVLWRRLKRMLPDWAFLVSREASISESEMRIELWNGAVIRCAGLDKPERIEGVDWDGGGITEFDNTKSGILDEHIYPMMTRGGWIDVEGVPEGRRHLFELVSAIEDGKMPDAAAHHWTAEETLHLYLGRERAEATLARARATMDPLVYQQEYLASFVNFQGLAYYQFDRDVHVGQLYYDPELPVIFAFDFNRKPGTASVIQEQRAPSWLRSPRHDTVTAIVDEVFIPQNSNTGRVCDVLIDRYAEIHDFHEVHIHGDPAGGNKTSQALKGSDWEIVRAKFEPVFGHRMRRRYAKSDPGIRPRVNAVNSRLMGADGTVGMVVSSRCRNMIRDFEGVEADEKGDLLKVKDDPLSHLCFTPDTRISTPMGIRRIGDIGVGDLVETPIGQTHSSRFGDQWACDEMVRVKLSDGSTFECTANHPILTTEGWVHAEDCSASWLPTYRSSEPARTQSSSRGTSIDDTNRIDISRGRRRLAGSASRSDCIVPYGRPKTESHSSLVSACITSTETSPTIGQRTSKGWSSVPTWHSTWSAPIERQRLRSGLEGSSRERRSGTAQKMATSGTESTIESTAIGFTEKVGFDARAATRCSSPMIGSTSNIALDDALPPPGAGLAWMTRQEIARRAARSFERGNTPRSRTALRVVRVEPCRGARVSCISVPLAGCFLLESGVAVSNSDGCAYYCAREHMPRSKDPIESYSRFHDTERIYD